MIINFKWTDTNLKREVWKCMKESVEVDEPAYIKVFSKKELLVYDMECDSSFSQLV